MPDNQEEKAPPNTLVCGRTMTIAPETYLRAEYQGRVIYFCTEFCIDAFNADPDRFYKAHSKSAKKDVVIKESVNTE